MLKTLSKADAKKEFNTWEFESIPTHTCDAEEQLELRNNLLEADKRAKDFLSKNAYPKNKKDYLYDLRFGIELYSLLDEKYGITTRQASNDDIWVYLSINVIPDIVYNRWGLKESRFYKQSRRIWLKTLWWYIHLSWNNTSEETFNTLKNFTTDEIVQLVERSGPNGYRIDVTREIMRQFSLKQLNKENRNLFRKIMKLNTARVKIIEPALLQGGTKKYVEELIRYFDETEKHNSEENKVEYTQSG